jgi:hypothetical protein
MKIRLHFLSFFLLPTLVAHVVQADDLPAIGQRAVATPSGLEEEPSVGLEMPSLPLESRSSIEGYVGRYLPGAALDEAGGLRLRGGRAEDTAFELDGLRTRRLSVPLGMVQRLEVGTAGYGAAWSDVLGGVVGATTRSGSNRFHADVDLSAEFREPVTAEMSPSVSGPILRDRLFYVVAVRGQATREPLVQDPEGIIDDSPGRERKASGSALKLTFFPHPAHRLESLTLVNSSRSDYGGEVGTEQDAQPTNEQLEVATSLRWIGRWNAITARSQVGFQRVRDEEMPLLCRSEPEACDTIPRTVQKFPRAIQLDNWGVHEIQRDSEWQFVNAVEARLFERPWIRQGLRLSSRVRLRQLSGTRHTPGDRLFELNNGPEAQTLFFATDPRVSPQQFGWFSWSGSYQATSHALESETRLFDRLWIVPGLGLTASRARTDFFTLGAAALTPHLGLAWDARGDGRTWLRASSHQRAGADLEALVRFGRAAPWSQRCTFNPDTNQFDKSCVFSGGYQGSVGLPCGADGVAPDGAPCGEQLRLARAWEHAISVEHEVGWNVRPFVELVYRRLVDLPQVTETNRLWNLAGEAVTGYRNGRQEEVRNYSTTGAAERYLDLTVGVRKEVGALRALASYTYSRHRDIIEIDDGAYTGSTADERPHSFRALLTHDFWGYGSLGVTATVESGAPIKRLFRNAGGYDYRAPDGANPGTNLVDPPDDRLTRLDAITRLDLQLRVRTKRLVGLDFHLYADFMNIFDLRAGELEQPTSFIPVRGETEGRWVRVGLGYRY